jgi:hypothetical protein
VGDGGVGLAVALGLAGFAIERTSSAATASEFQSAHLALTVFVLPVLFYISDYSPDQDNPKKNNNIGDNYKNNGD